jgi:hypothetical protein
MFTCWEFLVSEREGSHKYNKLTNSVAVLFSSKRFTSCFARVLSFQYFSLYLMETVVYEFNISPFPGHVAGIFSFP